MRCYICTKQEVCLTDVESLSDGDKEECNEKSLLQDGLDSDTECHGMDMTLILRIQAHIYWMTDFHLTKTPRGRLVKS